MTRALSAAAALLATAAAACSRSDPDRSLPLAPTAPEAVALQPIAAAISLYERRTAADPRDHLSATTLAELRLRAANESLDAEEFRRAELAARTALERQPGHPPAIVALARALAGRDGRTEARRLVGELLDAQPRDVGALGTAFDLALAESDERGAAIYAERLLAINEEPATLSRMAQLAARRGEIDRAVVLFRRAASDADNLGGLPAESAEYRRRAGMALGAANRPDEALREFDAALVANPRDADALIGRANLLAERGDEVGAAAALTSALAIRPTADVRDRLDALRAAQRSK